MRRRIALLLIVVPAAFLAWGLVDTVIKSVGGYYVEGETSTALIILGMMAVVALVPIGLGWWLLTSSRRDPLAEGRAESRHVTPREILGWLLLVPGLVLVPLRIGGGTEGGLGIIGPLAAVLVVVGLWIVATERRLRRSEQRQLTKSG